MVVNELNLDAIAEEDDLEESTTLPPVCTKLNLEKPMATIKEPLSEKDAVYKIQSFFLGLKLKM